MYIDVSCIIEFLNLLNEFRKRDKMRGINLIKIDLKSRFCCEKFKVRNVVIDVIIHKKYIA